MEILNILICITIVFYFSQIMNILINLWQSTEIKEEKSTPLYITKKVE